MMDESDNSRENLKHDEVVLEKTGHHVEVFGSYTKKELRRLLLSSSSLHPDADNEQEALEYTEINEQELKNIKNGERVSENFHQKFQDLEIPEDMIKETENVGKENSNNHFIDNQNGNSVNQIEEVVQTRENDFINRDNNNEIEDNKKSFENSKDNLIHHSNQKHLEDNIKTQLLQNDITEGKISLLENLTFSTDDMESLQKYSQEQMNQTVECDSARSAILKNSSTDYVSLNNNLYLKSAVFAPIKKAICEIILRKPNDPVEFLGQWLLHFKICEERTRKRKECEAKLSTERDTSNMKQIFETEVYNLIENEDEIENETE